MILVREKKHLALCFSPALIGWTILLLFLRLTLMFVKFLIQKLHHNLCLHKKVLVASHNLKPSKEMIEKVGK